MKKELRLLVFFMSIIALSGFNGGCKKAEQAKEEPKSTAQQVAPTMAPAGGSALAEFTFEDGTQKWIGRKGVKFSQDTSQNHGGNAGLKIAGTSGKGEWDFAESPKFNLVPGKHYKFSGWMKVDSIKPADPKTYCWLKVGIYKDNQWKKNVISNNYDLTKKGEWQLLSAEFDAPADNNLTGNFTIDKRPQDKDITATIFVDDIKIEQIN